MSINCLQHPVGFAGYPCVLCGEMIPKPDPPAPPADSGERPNMRRVLGLLVEYADSARRENLEPGFAALMDQAREVLRAAAFAAPPPATCQPDRRIHVFCDSVVCGCGAKAIPPPESDATDPCRNGDHWIENGRCTACGAIDGPWKPHGDPMQKHIPERCPDCLSAAPPPAEPERHDDGHDALSCPPHCRLESHRAASLAPPEGRLTQEEMAEALREARGVLADPGEGYTTDLLARALLQLAAAQPKGEK